MNSKNRLTAVMGFALAVLLSIPGLADLPSAGLVGYWGLDGDALDSSGNGHDGVVYGAVPTVDRFGNPNKAYYFDGTNDYIAVTNDGSLSPGSMTLSVWARIDKIAQPPGGNATSFIGISEDYKGHLIAYGQPYGSNAWFGTGNGSEWSCAGPYRYTVGQWNHYVLTYDTQTLVQTLYANGVRAGTENSGLHMVYSYTNMVMGRHAYQTAAGWWFRGALDEVRLYNRALDTNEISALYAMLVAPTNVAASDGTGTNKIRRFRV